MFLTAAIPSVLFFFALMFVPESPRWLMEFGRGEEALRNADARQRRAPGAGATGSRFREAIAQEGGSLRELLRPGLRTALLIGIVLAILQQITGINTVLFYGSIIFKDHAASGQSSALFANVFVGAVNFLSTIVALWIIDQVGRKALLMFSAAAMALSEIALGIAFLITAGAGQPDSGDHSVLRGQLCDGPRSGRVGGDVGAVSHAHTRPRPCRSRRSACGSPAWR